MARLHHLRTAAMTVWRLRLKWAVIFTISILPWQPTKILKYCQKLKLTKASVNNRQTAVFLHDLPRRNSINTTREWMGHNVVTTVSLTRPSYFARSIRLVRSKELGWPLSTCTIELRKIDSFARYLRVPHHHLGRSHYLVNLYVTSEYYPTILYNLHKQWFRKSGTDLERILNKLASSLLMLFMKIFDQSSLIDAHSVSWTTCAQICKLIACHFYFAEKWHNIRPRPT